MEGLCCDDLMCSVPAGVMFNPAVSVCVGQLGRGARPGDDRSQRQYLAKAFLTQCDCVVAEKPNPNLIHTFCNNPEEESFICEHGKLSCSDRNKRELFNTAD